MTREEWLIFSERIKKVWGDIKRIVKEVAGILKDHKEPLHHQTKWNLILDTRLKSQVMDNKPKHLVKKVRM